ncbi:MAG: ComF family protein, partial [Bryobacteraceae bacterium]
MMLPGLLRNTRKTGTESSIPPEEQASSSPVWGHAAVPFALLRNTRKTGTESSIPPEEQAGSSPVWGHAAVPFALGSLSSKFFNLVFPDECRLCDQPLRSLSRIPVCPACLDLPQRMRPAFSCRGCGTPFVEAFPLDEQDLCTVCRESQVNFDAAYSFGSYEGALRDLIHLLKYAKVESLATPLGRMMVSAVPENGNFDLVVAMPMHWRKRWERGFNQAELLASPVARFYGVKLSRCLRRSRYTKAQASLGQQDRLKNLEGSFSVRTPDAVAGKRILLVDDVFTTGATLRAATSALKGAGASHVSALALARAEQRRFEQSSKEHAQNGHGNERATRGNSDVLPRLVARSRALCASTG